MPTGHNQSCEPILNSHNHKPETVSHDLKNKHSVIISSSEESLEVGKDL